MRCKNDGCPNTTTAKNGLCPSCYRIEKDLKRYLLSRSGFEFLRNTLQLMGYEVIKCESSVTTS